MLDDTRIDLDRHPRVWLFGAGKAAAPMAAAVAERLDDRLHAGLVVTKHRHAEPVAGCEVLEAGHPVPDEQGLAAARRLETVADRVGEADLVVVCLTGGASALLPAPRPPLTLADLQATTSLLLAAGADIAVVNLIRRHCSRLKGGGLLRRLAPARVATLAISDVLGDAPEAIGSGPTAADPGTFEQARDHCRRLGLWRRLPDPVRRLLDAGCAGTEAETLKPGDPALERASYHLAASNRQALDAAERSARAEGWVVDRLPEPITGDAAAAGRALATRLAEHAAAGRRVCLVAGGEPTVVLPPDHGAGGRNQHLALAAAEVLAGGPARLLAAGTDGTDGPTDAAGAVVDGTTWQRAVAAGLDPDRALARCDANPLLERLDALVVTGPTGTNVMDVVVGVTG